jgi:DNA-binding response OmpR family regulator
MKRVSDLEIDVALRIVRQGGQSAPLTPPECRLLELLAQCRAKAGAGAVPWEYLWGPTPAPDSHPKSAAFFFSRWKVD